MQKKTWKLETYGTGKKDAPAKPKPATVKKDKKTSQATPKTGDATDAGLAAGAAVAGALLVGSASSKRKREM